MMPLAPGAVSPRNIGPIGMLARVWPDAQAELILGLETPEAFPHAPARIRHLQTHISHVFLTGEYAFKVKKPLKLDFLDFSTLEKRRLACEEELRINRRLAPDLYLAVVPITGSGRHPRVEGAGDPVEYAVKMREFHQEDLLERVLHRGAITSRMMDAVARQVAAFHCQSGPSTPPEGCGTGASILSSALDNFTALRALLTESGDLELLTWLQTWTLEEGGRLQPHFEQRRSQGFVRDGHGDLHLGNLALYAGDVRIFDAIDFNAALRWVDVINDVVFLVMDLAFRRRRDLAYRFLNQYLEHTGDYAGVQALRYYLVYRAMVRAKVEALRAGQGDVSDRQRDACMRRCRDHLGWARETIVQRRSAIIALHGFSGSGKTSRSMTLLETIGAIRIRSDVERKRLHGMPPTQHLQHEVEQGLYDRGATEQTYEYLADMAGRIVRAGVPVIVDATFLQRRWRDVFRRLADAEGVPFVIADFLADRQTLRDRVAQRARHAVDASDAGPVVLEHQLLHHDALADDELAQVVPFDTERMTMRDMVTQAHHLLNVNRK